jgi:hypothetical protein
MPAHELQKPKEVSFNEENGFLVVNIDRQTYGYTARPVLLEGQRLEPKDELHITVLSREAADAAAGHLQAHPDDRQIQDLVDRTDWSYRRLGKGHHAREGEADTIIEMVDMPGLEGFFARLSEIVGRDLPVPPVHVTLYMRGTEKGIGLPTREVFAELVQGEVDLERLEWAAGEAGEAG